MYAVIFTSNCHDDVMVTSPQQASSWSWRWIFKIFWDRKNTSKETSYDDSSLSCLDTTRSRWATGL